MKLRYLVLVGASGLLTACASGSKEPGPAEALGRRTLEPAHLVAFAREIRASKGCADAVPAYRVVAAMGGGQEAAQHELGECLLAQRGASDAETALLQLEAEFWLTRAAYAGNARAQRALAVHYGAGDSLNAQPERALQWALVYSRNREADVLGYKTLPATFVPGLVANLPSQAVAKAEAFASTFSPIALAAFDSSGLKVESEDSKRRDIPPPQRRRR